MKQENIKGFRADTGMPEQQRLNGRASAECGKETGSKEDVIKPVIPVK